MPPSLDTAVHFPPVAALVDCDQIAFALESDQLAAVLDFCCHCQELNAWRSSVRVRHARAFELPPEECLDPVLHVAWRGRLLEALGEMQDCQFRRDKMDGSKAEKDARYDKIRGGLKRDWKGIDH